MWRFGFGEALNLLVEVMLDSDFDVSGSDHTVHDNWKSKLLGWLIGCLMRVMGMTYRVKCQDLAGVTDRAEREPVIYVIWHNRIFSAISTWPKTGGHMPVVALASASKDGGILASALRVIGVETARGSSSRRGAAALVMLRRALRDHKDVYITPDGPRGPCYILQPGALKLAQASGAAIVVQLVREKRFWQLNSWDKLRVPKPFTQIELIFEERIQVPREFSDVQLEDLRCSIEARMNRYNSRQNGKEN